MSYTPEEIERTIELVEDTVGTVALSSVVEILSSYAATLRQSADSGRVGDEVRVFPAGKMPPEKAEMVEASLAIGSWLSAALDDPKVCSAMKRDINRWFDAAMPSALAAQGQGEAVYQCMCTDPNVDEDGNKHEDDGKVWMDVPEAAYVALSKRPDVRARIVYTHLTQPAQAVDVGAVVGYLVEKKPRVVNDAPARSFYFADQHNPTDPDWWIAGEQKKYTVTPLTRALGNAQAEGWKVPDVNWLADQLCELRNKWAEGCEANWLETDDNHPDDWMAKELHKRLIASPTPPQPEE